MEYVTFGHVVGVAVGILALIGLGAYILGVTLSQVIPERIREIICSFRLLDSSAPLSF